MTLEDKVHAFRLHLFRRAQELGNVSAACRELGVSRSLYYQLRKRFVGYGPDGLHPKRHRGRPGRPPQLDATVERQVIALALRGPAGVRSNSPTSWRCGGSTSLAARPTGRSGATGWAPAENASASSSATVRSGGPAHRADPSSVQKARPTASQRHVEAKDAGELVCLDCFYIGKLKGVGKVWQITACDAASSYGLAMVFIGDPVSDRCSLPPRARGPPLPQGGLACPARPHRPRQRVQGRVRRGLPEARRPAHPHQTPACLHQRLRRAIAADDPPRSLAGRVPPPLLHHAAAARGLAPGYLRFYNHERAHHGYRTRGRTPAQIVWGAQNDKA